MEPYIATAAAIVAVVGAMVSTVLGIWTARQTRQAQQVAAYRAVHDLYDKMVQLKFDHPGLVPQAQQWNEAKMAIVYDADAPLQVDWSRYCTFVELCIGFSTAVLQARSRHLMGDDDFKKQWEPLVRIVVAEHYPIISAFDRGGPYLSLYLREYMREVSLSNHWDWNERHRALAWPTIGDGLQQAARAAGAVD